MELVYLWVEDYKNIHQQGFNFSPRFRCEYDGETLRIEENDEYIPDFFGENINVTAIVGKNGSGKSSVLEIIYLLLNNRHNLINSFFILFSHKNKIYLWKNNIKLKKMNCQINNLHDNSSILRDSYCSIYINYNSNNNLIKIINRKQGYCEDNFICKHTIVFSKYQNLLMELKDKYKFNKFILVLGLKDETIIHKKDHNNNLILDSEDIQRAEKIITEIYGEKSFIKRKTIGMKLFSFKKQLLYNAFLFYIDYLQNFKNYFKDNEYKDYLKDIQSDCTLDNLFKVLNKFYQIVLTKIDKKIADIFKEFYDELLFIKRNEDLFLLDESRKNYIAEIDLTQRDKIFNIIHNTKNSSGLLSDDNYMTDFIWYDFVNSENGTRYNDLSDGEKEILTISVELIYYLDNCQNKNILIIYDEIDNYLHPTWKKEIFSIQIKLMKKFIILSKNMNIILLFTTHSPFLLSDIPKQNIIFLDKDEKGNCKVVDGLNEKEQTFGANIHTLLSDSFFMEDGLMGEFAKGKINEIIDFHKKMKDKDTNIASLKKEYAKKRDKFYQTQSIVGEAYLKQILENHLLEIDKILLGNDKAKEKLRERLEQQLRALDE